MVGGAGLEDRFELDSAGTGQGHVGQKADARMRSTAKRRGVDLDDIRARQVARGDLHQFDHIFAMDRSNLHDMLYLDPDGDHSTRVRLFREFDPEPDAYQVPDPYYGGPNGFDNVLDIVQRQSVAILDPFRAVCGW